MGSAAANPRLTRHFVTIDGRRQVHYLRGGRGAPVLILHPSPGPSRYLLPLLEFLCDHFTVIAPDTPGNGLSDPLPLAAPTMDDYGDNVAKVLDALGLDRIALYGFHTGASVGTAFAIRHPRRVLGAVLDGFLVETDTSLHDRLTHYLPPFEPKPDGSHLTWLWTRLRDQGMYAKWYAPSRASRFDTDPPPPEAVHRTVLDWLDAGTEYIKPYSAAFRQRGHLQVMRFTTPTVLCAADGDGLLAHLDRLPTNLPACVEVKRYGAREKANDFVLAELRRFAAGTPPPGPRIQPLADRPYQDYVAIPGGQVHVRRSDAGTGRPVVILHDAIGDNRVVDGITRGFHGRRPAVALDLPGHGSSDNTLGPRGGSLARYAEAVAAALDGLGFAAVDLVGLHTGALLALEVALLRPARVKHGVLVDLPPHDEHVQTTLRLHYAPPLEPDFAGSHLQRAWFLARDHGQFWPWFDRHRNANLNREPFTPAEVHRHVVALLRAGPMVAFYAAAAFAQDTGAVLARIAAPIARASIPGGPLHLVAQRDAGPPVIDLPEDREAWAAALLPFLDR